MTQRSFGNGLTESRRYDLQGRLLSQTLSGQPSGGGGVQAPSIIIGVRVELISFMLG